MKDIILAALPSVVSADAIFYHHWDEERGYKDATAMLSGSRYGYDSHIILEKVREHLVDALTCPYAYLRGMARAVGEYK